MQVECQFGYVFTSHLPLTKPSETVEVPLIFYFLTGDFKPTAWQQLGKKKKLANEATSATRVEMNTMTDLRFSSFSAVNLMSVTLGWLACLVFSLFICFLWAACCVSLFTVPQLVTRPV